MFLKKSTLLMACGMITVGMLCSTIYGADESVTPAETSIPAKPAAYWPFDKGSGTIAADASTNGHDGIIVSASWTGKGKSGSALVFDGDKSYVSFDVMQFKDSFTYSIFVKPYNLIDSYMLGADNNNYIRISHRKSLLFKFNGKNVIFALDNPLKANSWIHLAFVRNAENQIHAYVNGTKQSASGSSTATAKLGIIGAKRPGSGFFNGVIDEVIIYDRALNETEISSLANMKTTPQSTGVDNASGNTITKTNAVADTVVSVKATVETKPMPMQGDRADDACFWIHPKSPEKSIIIGTNKDLTNGGLHVYDLNGKELQFVPCGKINNVDMRYNFPLNGKKVALVIGTNRVNDTLAIFKVDPATRKLVNVTGTPIKTMRKSYGICMYQSKKTNKTYAIVNSKGGRVQQWELFAVKDKVEGKLVRSFSLSSIVEGCVADDELGHLYIGEELKAIWKYGAEPDDGSKRIKIDKEIVAGGHFKHDVEGLTLYYAEGGKGYLLASSQGNSTFIVYEREGNNKYIGTFKIIAGSNIDAVDGTDGIDVINVPMGKAFPNGAFVVQDNSDNGGALQNYKLVPWESIARAIHPALIIDTTWNPRK
jgi:3-phytase